MSTTNTETAPKLTEFVRYGDHGWRWTVRGRNGKEWEHRTNRNGEGLWYISPSGDEHQTAGTAQYELPREEAAARAKAARDCHCEE